MKRGRWLEAALEEARAGSADPPGRAPLRQAVSRALAHEPLGLRDVGVLLRSAEADEAEEALVQSAFAAREEIFGRRVGLFAPLYYSNVCSNDCVYCGFRRSLGNARRRLLAPGEIAAEARHLLADGHRRILLIASEDPTPRGMAMAVEAIEAVRSAGTITRGTWSGCNDGIFLAAELAPRPAAEFAELARLGVSAYVLFQETYDPDLYPRVHPSGPKADFHSRLEGMERAAAAGVPFLGLGALFGLGDPVLEAMALVAHARHLEMLTGRPVASVSAPRIEPADGVPFSFHPPRPLPDRQWLRLLCVLRLALPQTELIVSTRESIGLRRASLRVGATVFSAGSSTEPGGYGQPGSARGQFRVGDERSLSEVADDLRAMGYEPSTGATAGNGADRALGPMEAEEPRARPLGA